MALRKLLLTLLVGGLLAAGPFSAVARAEGDRPPVVLELFTSQGCSSCPPADDFLAELADMRDDVLALSFHVDYWDYIGWEDPFATAETTRRQHAYARTLGLSYVYTPQMVINGRTHAVGSDEQSVYRAIEGAHERQQPGLAIEVANNGRGGVSVSIPGASFDGDAVIWLIIFDRMHRTQVRAGENAGRTMVNRNVVRQYRRVGTWRGDAMTLTLPGNELATDSDGEGCAVLVQGGDGAGAILGAASLWLTPTGS